ncbi:hypothetical protein ACWGI1_00570 [Streptomyces sp. NPDC054835]|uniref:hypothetical protein n=1 Tax=Streptomyces exfoliatus TaxID=1905 RepID=UPI00046679E8|nr:hypothetical protein [Streptomyces exfoliatus]
MTPRPQTRSIFGLWAMPDWIPRSSATLPRICGRDFDAVRVNADIARPALAALGPCTGPVLANNTTRTWHFLLEPGSVPPGRWGTGARVMPYGASIGIPPLTTTAGRDVHWAVLPGRGVTSADDLHRVLTGPLTPAARTRAPGSMPSVVTAAPARAVVPARSHPLSPAQLMVGRLLLTGESDAQMAQVLARPIGTVRQHLNRIGRQLGAPTAARKAAALLAGGHLPPPPVPMLAPELAPPDLTVLHVLAGLTPEDSLPGDLQPTGPFLDHVDELRLRCGARTDAHLIALAAAWNLLPSLAHAVPAPTKEKS